MPSGRWLRPESIASAPGVERKQRLDAVASAGHASRDSATEEANETRRRGREDQRVRVADGRRWSSRAPSRRERSRAARDFGRLRRSSLLGFRASLGWSELSSLRTRYSDLIAAWSRPKSSVAVRRPQDMSWTCPDCSRRHQTTIDPSAEHGKIIEVNCEGCGKQHAASVFFRLRQSGTPRMTVGVVWL